MRSCGAGGRRGVNRLWLVSSSQEAQNLRASAWTALHGQLCMDSRHGMNKHAEVLHRLATGA